MTGILPGVIGTPTALMPSPYVAPDGRRFALLPDVNRGVHNVQRTRFAGEDGWLAVEAHSGDRNNGESGVERVGLDGYVQPWAYDPSAWMVSRFKWVPLFGIVARAAGQHVNFFEMHSKPDPAQPGEYGGPGLVRLECEWSAGASMPVFRAWQNAYVLDTNGRATAGMASILYQAPAGTIVEGMLYDIVVKARYHDTAGAFQLTINGVTLTDQRGLVGFTHGPNRLPYPQLRNYREARATPSRALFKPISFGTEPFA